MPDLILPILILWLLSPVAWSGGHATGMFTPGWVPHGAYYGMTECKKAGKWHAKVMKLELIACRPYNMAPPGSLSQPLEQAYNAY